MLRWDSCDMSPGSILSNLSSGSSSNQSNNAPTGPIVSWCHKAVWASGSIVKHGKFIYTVGSYSSAAAEPGNDMHWRFYVSTTFELFNVLFIA